MLSYFQLPRSINRVQVLYSEPTLFPFGTECEVDTSALLLVVVSPTVLFAICAENLGE